MPDATEQRIAGLHRRLEISREDIFALAHALKGDHPQSESGSQQPVDQTEFPRSRIMRALLGQPGRMLLGGAVVTLTVARPKLLWRAIRFTPMLRGLFMRYLLPRLLGQR